MHESYSRDFRIERARAGKNERELELSFASETPVERPFGLEVLSMEPGAVDLSRFNSGSGPLLWNHDTDNLIGSVLKAWVENGKARARVRFGNSAKAKEVQADVADGVISTVSVGYRINEIKEENDVSRVTKWTPLEISIVSVPADTSVGIGRSSLSSKQKMKELELESVREIGREVEDSRSREIESVSNRLKDKIPGIEQLAARAILMGTSLNEFRKMAFEMMPNVKPLNACNSSADARIGMSERDLEQYSVRKAIVCACNGRYEGLEGEMHQEAERNYKNHGTPRQAGGPASVIVPYDVLIHSKRDMLVGTSSLGGNLVSTDLLAGSFIGLLRNRMMVARMGARFLTGLIGNVAIPRQNGAASLFWAASEAAATTESSLTFDQVTMTPKQATARVDYSYLTLLQTTPALESLIREDLANIIALGIDLAALHGSGAAGQPTGLASISGIGSVAGGTNGAQINYSHVLALEKAVSVANADLGTLGYLANAKARNTLKQTYTNSTYGEIPVWSKGVAQDIGTLNDYPAGCSNQAASNLTKGTSTTVCSATFFGNWMDLLIGQWGGLEILVNPYSQAANRIYEVYAYQAVDINVRHPESFAAMLDGLTI
jgi:HK97 family phage major capsid protein/HK97 family phage prohead protease